MSRQNIDIDPIRLGGLPLVDQIARRLDIQNLFEKHVPRDPREKIPASTTLYLILANVILSRFPLYKMGGWAETRGLLARELTDALNDDRVGRALHRLFHADRSSLLTAVVLNAILGYDLHCENIHNDSTSITLFGRYDMEHQAAKPKRGHNKDHRPDLKQLLFDLTVCGDGAVPLYFKVWDGNVTDDTTHLRNWMSIRGLLGKVNFTYVADSKLCTRETLTFIDSEGGTFVTILPKTRKEDQTFKDWIQAHTPDWQEVRRRKGHKQSDPDSVYFACESPIPSAEGFRIIWVKSTDKQHLDEEKRRDRIDQTIQKLSELKEGKRGKSRGALELRVREILKENQSEHYFNWQVIETEQAHFTQVQRGRPGKRTAYRKVTKKRATLSFASHEENIRYEARCDGLFPLLTNRRDPASVILEIYKYQPRLEKRHEQLKSVYHVAPVFLKHPERIEALLFLYFLGLLITSLLERTVRSAMKTKGFTSIPIYPEQRECKNPTADKILALFEDIRIQTVTRAGKPLRVIPDELNEI
jgi:transposase